MKIGSREYFKKTQTKKLTRKQAAMLRKFVPKPESKSDWLLTVSLMAHQDFIWKVRTTEIAAVLGISRSKAYNLCCEAEKAGTLVGYQASFDYTEDLPRKSKKFNREAIVWEIWIRDRTRDSEGKVWDSFSDLEELVPKLKRKIAKYSKQSKVLKRVNL